MLTRDIAYTSHRPSADALVKHYVVAEVDPEGGPLHAILVPRAWTPVTPLPVAEAPTSPLLCSLFLEQMPPNDQTASLQVHTLPRSGADAAAVTDGFADHEGLLVTSREVNGDGERAWARNDQIAVMIRVFPISERWLVAIGRCPLDRVEEVGGALDYGLQSLVLGPTEAPTWSLEVG